MKDYPNVNWIFSKDGYYYGEDEIGYVRYKDKIERLNGDLVAYTIQTLFNDTRPSLIESFDAPKDIDAQQKGHEGWGKNVGKIMYYDLNFYCQENYSIHTSKKATLNCKYCSKRWYKK